MDGPTKTNTLGSDVWEKTCVRKPVLAGYLIRSGCYKGMKEMPGGRKATNRTTRQNNFRFRGPQQNKNTRDIAKHTARPRWLPHCRIQDATGRSSPAERYMNPCYPLSGDISQFRTRICVHGVLNFSTCALSVNKRTTTLGAPFAVKPSPRWNVVNIDSPIKSEHILCCFMHSVNFCRCRGVKSKQKTDGPAFPTH